MTIRPSKQTEVGAIPQDWASERISDAAGNSANAIVGGPFGSDLVSADYVVSGIPVIRGQNMAEDVVSGDFVFVSPQKAKSLSANLAYPGDLVFTQRGTLGQVAVVPDGGHQRYLVSQSQMKVTLNRVRHDPWFVHQYFASRAGQKQIALSAIQTGVPHTNLGILRAYRFPAPPLAEQRAIAETLSDADALLAGLDRLIAKKRDLKQAAMQQLLTGQTRLPGFHGEWETRLLPVLAEIRSGGTPSTNDHAAWDGDIAWCTPTDITALAGGKYLTGTARRITAHGLRQSSAEVIPAGSVVMTSRATIGECAINTVPMTTNQGFKNFVPFECVEAEFLYYLLTTQKAGFMSLCGGSTFLEIGKAQLRGYCVRVPANKSEQAAIAAILSDMDAELTVLEARRDKTRALKQGMMQELLTGRTRLV